MNPLKLLFALTILGCAPTKEVSIMSDFDAEMSSDAPTVIDVNAPVMFEIERFDKSTKDAVVNKLKEFKSEGRKNVWIRIDSFGGDVNSGMDMIQAIEEYPHPITCIADSKAMSMGFFLLQSCQVRAMTARSMLMAHKPAMNSGGREEDLISDIEYLNALTEGFLEVCAKRMALTKSEIRKKISGKDWFITKEEALHVKAVDKVIEPEDIPKNIVELEVAPQRSLFDLLSR